MTVQEDIEVEFTQIEDQLQLLEKLSDMDLTKNEVLRLLVLMDTMRSKNYHTYVSDEDLDSFLIRVTDIHDRAIALSEKIDSM